MTDGTEDRRRRRRAEPDPEDGRVSSAAAKNPATETPDFVLEDSDGGEHEYYVTPHDPTEATPVMVELAAAVSGPVGDFLESNKGVIIDAVEGRESWLDLEVAEALQDFDVQSLFRQLRTSLRELDVVWLQTEILRNTVRDGYPLDEAEHFNDAFRQNYGELYTAVWKVIRANGFLPSGGMPTGGSMTSEGESSTPVEGEGETAA